MFVDLQLLRSSAVVEIFCKIFAFFGKTAPYCKIFKILLRKCSLQHRSRCCVHISWNLANGKAVKSCVAYLTKNISPGFPALATAWIVPKICQSQPRQCTQECSRFHPNRFTLDRWGCISHASIICEILLHRSFARKWSKVTVNNFWEAHFLTQNAQKYRILNAGFFLIPGNPAAGTGQPFHNTPTPPMDASWLWILRTLRHH